MNDQVFNGRDHIYTNNYLKKSKESCYSSRIHDIAVQIINDFTTGPALAASKEQLALSTNDVSNYEGAISSHPEIRPHLLVRYSAESIVAKTNDHIHSFKQGS